MFRLKPRTYAHVRVRTIFSLMAPLWGLIAVLVVITNSLSPGVQAAQSTYLNFQARLLTNSGAVVPDGYYHVEFKLYNVVSGGSALWTETWSSNDNSNRIRVVNGYLTANLGADTAFPGTIAWDEQLWLTMNIGGTAGSASWDGEMNPRILLTALPYAFKSAETLAVKKVSGANTGTLSFNTVANNPAILLPDASGTVCLQSSSSCGFVAGTSANFIQNGTGVQTANFNIQSAAAGSIAALIQGAASQTADILQVKADGVTNPLFSISPNGSAIFRNSTNNDTAYQFQKSDGSNLLQLYTSSFGGGALLNGHLGISIAGMGSTSPANVHGVTIDTTSTIGSNTTGRALYVSSSVGGNTFSGVTNHAGSFSLLDNNATGMANLNIGVRSVITGSNTSSANIAVDASASRGFGIRGISSSATGVSNGTVACGNLGSLNNSVGVCGESSAATNAAYNAYGIYGVARGGTGSTAYGGYFTINTSSTATATALYASNATLASNIFQLQDGTTTGVGAKNVMTIADEGTALFQNRTDSTTAFQVQDAGGTSILTVNTSTDGIAVNGLTTLVANSAANGDALSVSNGTGSGNIAIFRDDNTPVLTIADGGGVTLSPLAANTGSALTITQAGNPTSGNALIKANNTNGTPSGNLLDLQTGGASRFSVDTGGNLTLGDTGNANSTIRKKMNVNGTVAVNDVVVLHSTAGNVSRTTTASDTKVFGVATGSGTPQDVVISGVYQVNLDDTTANVAIGDFIVTSSQTGTVTKASNPATGAVLGRAMSTTAAATSGQKIWVLISAGTGGSTDSLQTAYENSTTTEITLNSTNNGLNIQDNVSAISGNLFAVQAYNATSTYLGVSATATTIVGALNQSGGAISLQGNAASTITTTTGNLTIDATAANAQILIGTGTNAHTINIGTGGTGNQAVTIGSTNSGSTTIIQGGSNSTIDYTNFDVSAAGTVTIAAGQSYTGSGAVTLSSGGSAGLTLNSASGNIATGTNNNVVLNGTGGLIFSQTGNTNATIRKNMTVNAAVTAGDIVIISTAAAGTVTTTSTANSNQVFGIATTTNGSAGAQDIVTGGIYQVNIVPADGADGDISIGDFITTSATAGKGQKNVDPPAGTVIGRALSTEDAADKVWVYVTPGAGGTATTLQGAYSQSTSPEITVDSTRGAVTIRDNSTPLASNANLLEIQNNAGTTTYLGVNNQGISVAGTATISTSLQAPLINTASGVNLALQPATGIVVLNRASTANELRVYENAASPTNYISIKHGSVTTSSGALTLDTGSAAAINIGTTNADAINLQQNTAVASTKTFTVQGGLTSLTANSATNGDGLSVSNGTGSGNIAVFRDDNSIVMSVGDGGNVSISPLAANTGSGLTVTQAGNPSAGNALIKANNTNGTPSGNLLDLQAGGVSKLSVNTAGTISTSGHLSFTQSGNVAAAIQKMTTVSSAVNQYDVVVIDTSATDGRVSTTTTANSSQVFGIASTTNAGTNVAQEIVTGGVYQVNIVPVDGVASDDINVGDFITTSTTAGRGQVNNSAPAGTLIGRALSRDDASNRVWIYVTPGAGGSPTSLQQAYNLSSSPEIVLNTTNHGISIQDASGGVTGNLFEVQNNGGGTTYFGVSATGTSLTGTLSQAAGNLLAGSSGYTQTLTNASTSGGTVNGYNQTITVSNSGSASTTNGMNIALTDNGSLANVNRGIVISLAGTNTSQYQTGIDASVNRGVGINASSTGVGSWTCGGQNINLSVGVCGGSTASTGGVGLLGITSSGATSANNAAGSGVTGYNTASGTASEYYYGLQARTIQSAAGAYTSYGVYGQGRGGSGATAYGGYFTLDSSGASLGSALYATNAATTANILQLQDNTTDVLRVANGGAVLFQNSTNSSTAVQVLNSTGSVALNIDTTPLNSLISNSNFEETNLYNWAGKGAATVAHNATVGAYIGTGSLQVTTTTAANDGASYNLSLTNGATYAFSFSVRQVSGTALTASNFAAGWNNGTSDTNCTLSPGLASQAPVSTGWVRYSCTFTATASGHVYVKLSSAIGTAVVFNIDAVQVEQASAPTAYKETAITLNGKIDSALALQNKTNSTTAFQVQNTAGASAFVVDTLNRRIGVAIDGGPTEALQVGGNILASGNITASDFIFSSGISAQRRYSLSRTLSNTDVQYVEIGNFAVTNGAHNLQIGVTVSEANFSVAKQYNLPLRYDATTGAWKDVLPLTDSGPYGSENFVLEVRVSNDTAYLRLRRVAGSVTGAVANINIIQMGSSNDTFTATSGTGASNTNNGVFIGTSITQDGLNGRVGIQNAAPAYTLDVSGIINTSSYVRTPGIVTGSGTLGVQAANGIVALNTASVANDLRVYENAASPTQYISVKHGSVTTSTGALAIDTGSAAAVNIGSTTANAVNLGANTSVASTKTFTVSGGKTTLTANSAINSDAIDVSNGTGGGNIALFRDDNTPVLTIANQGAFTFRNIDNSATGYQFQNASGHASLVLDTTNKHLRIYENSVSAPTKYADIYYDSATSTANYTASSGTVAVGTGAGAITITSGSGAGVNITGDAASLWRTTTGSLTLQSGTSSDLILNAGSAVVSLSGSNVLKLGTNAGNPGTCTAGAVIYNSTTSRLIGCEGSTWMNLTSNLQEAYNISTSSSPEIKIDTTRGSFDIQDANTTVAGDLMTVRATNSGGLGTVLFGVDSSGNTRLQNTSGTNLLKANATSSRVEIGSPTSHASNPIILVLDNYNNATEPTGTNGAMYYNVISNKFRCYENSAWKDCIYGFNTLTKTSDQAAPTSNTTFQNDNTLTFSVAANSSYVFDAWIPVDHSTAAGMKYTFTTPASATLNISTSRYASASTDTICNITTSGQSCVENTLNANDFIKVTGYVRTAGTAGSVTFQFGQQTSTASAFPVIKAGATLSWHTTN